MLLKVATGKESRLKNTINTMIIEKKATVTLKGIISNKTMWTNLVPLAMLIVAIAVFFIAKSITNYGGDLTNVINNGVFVAVVATGAVYIYSNGSFDKTI